LDGLAPHDEENGGHKGQDRQDEALVLKREAEEIDESVEKEPEAE
jgi:hypothetical protein